MTKVATLILVFVFGSLLPAQTANKATGKDQSSSGPVQATITKLEQEGIEAALKGDASWGEKYDADDYIGISPTGGFSDKKTSVSNMSSGQTKYEKIDVKDLKVTLYGPFTAIARGTADVKGTGGGQVFEGTYAYSRVWVKRDSKWQVAAFQASKMQ